jgi:DnaJ family protein C protein 25
MILFRRVLLVVVLAVSCSRVCAAHDEEDTGGTASTEEVGESAPTTTIDNNNARPSSPCNENDWGSFYDPNNIFCGKFDCYKILCFDYETWGSDPPTLKAITKSYRNLSRKWHPDKNKAKGAREKFVVSTIE